MSRREVPQYARGAYLTVDQRRQRLAERLAEVVLWLDRSAGDVDGWTFDGAPLPLGAPWPSRFGVHTLAARDVTAPDDWPQREVRLDLALGGEGLLRIGEHRYGLDPFHRRFPLQRRTVDVEVEMVARRPFGEPNREPRIEQARLVWGDTAVEQFARQLSLVLEAVDVLGDDDAVEPMLACAERALAGVDWPSRTSEYVARSAESPVLLDIWELPADLDPAPPGLTEAERASVQRASTQLAAELAELRTHHPPRGSLLFTGHAHLDMAWLWPLDETRRKALRTSWTVVNLMASYPEFTFNQSSAQLYRFIAEDDPALFEAIEKSVAAGQWEPIGGMWVEPDGNMPCGESFVRQLLYGQRAFESMFGSAHGVGWLPDSFGFSPGLPQLLAAAGIDSLFTQKLNRADTNQFPHDLYWWEGLDGTRILVHGFDNPNGSYDAMLGPDAMVRTWQNSRGKQVHPESLLSVGYGDGGGGPTADMIERSRLLTDFPALPKAAFGRVADIFDRMRRTAERVEVPVWSGELYLEFHRGVFTTQGRVKWLHRRAERDLVAAEVLGALRGMLTDERPPSLADEWQTLLLNQFHDILPGSSIREVNVTAEAQLAEVVAAAAGASAEHLAALAGVAVPAGEQPGLFVVNVDLATRGLRVQLDAEVPGAQPVEGGAVVAAAQTVAGLEAKVVVDLAPEPGLQASPSHLENNYVRVDLDETGALARVYDKRAGRDVLAGRGNELWAYVDKPRLYDAWEIDPGYLDAGVELTDAESIELVESGPHRAAVRVRRRFRSSEVVQDIRLWANSPRIDVHTVIDWHDRHWLLKAHFPLAVRSDTATFETAFGVVRRPTHRNSSWDAAKYEVPGHRFADLSEPGYGVALLNDGRYGHHARGNDLGISLLRSPVYPDPLADDGRHELTYALLPHRGDWHEGNVLAEAEDLNRPLFAMPVRAAGPAATHPLRISGVPLGLGALKASEDGADYVLRCYEPFGARGEATVHLPDGWELAGEVSLLEARVGPPGTAFSPFQVRSWRVARRG